MSSKYSQFLIKYIYLLLAGAAGLVILSIKLKFFLDQIAVGGYSPIGWIYKISYPQTFLRDFPSGIENYDMSLFMQIYKLFNYFSLPPERALFLVIAAEFLIFCVALWQAIKILPNRELHWPTWCWLTLLIANGSALPSFANFQFPLFFGQFYVFAEALRIIGISLALQSRFALSYPVLGLAILIHPTIGIIGPLFILPSIVRNYNKALNPRALATGCATAIVSTLYFLPKLSHLGSGGGTIPNQAFSALSRLLNFHYYPIDMGSFTSHGTEVLLPFLSLILLGWLSAQYVITSNLRKDLYWGMLVILGVSILGVVGSELISSQSFLKLCLHRSSNIISLFSLLLSVNFFVSHFSARSVTSSTFIFLLVLLTPLNSSNPYTLLLVALLFWRLPKEYVSLPRPTTWGGNILILGAASWLVTMLAMGYRYRFGDSAFFVPTGYRFRDLLLVLLAIGTLAYIKKFASHRKVALLSCLFFIGFLFKAIGSIPQHEDAVRNSSYREIQIWAKENTPIDSLFSVDPAISYGWRDFSQRSSFGNFREWLMASWLYNSDFRSYEMGLSRFAEFDDITKYLNSPDKDNARQNLETLARKRFNSFSDGLHRRLTEKYGINYFVFEKRYLSNQAKIAPLYENDHFVVVKASDFIN